MFKIRQIGIARVADALAAKQPTPLSLLLLMAALGMSASPAHAQSFRVQCPTSTITHPATLNPGGSLLPNGSTAGPNDAELAYVGPTTFTSTNTTTPGSGYLVPSKNVNGAIKCQQVSGGDGYSTMADGTQTFMFSFGPLSGIADIAAGKPGTEPPSIFRQTFQAATGTQCTSTTPTTTTNGVTIAALCTPVAGDPATTDGAVASAAGGWGSLAAGVGGYQGGTASEAVTVGAAKFGYNGAIGIAPDIPYLDQIFDISEGASTIVTVVLNAPNNFGVGDTVIITGTGTGYDGKFTVTTVNIPNPYFPDNFAFQYDTSQQQNPPPAIKGATGLADINSPSGVSAASIAQIDGHVDPRQIIDVGVMNGNIPAPLIAFDEDDELFLTLTNVGMIMRPDLFEQHTIHFHGYPNASSFYDGVPDASVAINIGGSFTYYYLAPDAGTYFWHCHITPPEHLQMGMVGQLFVRPRQNRVPKGESLYAALTQQQGDLRTACNTAADVLCSNPLPAVNTGATQGTNKSGGAQLYVYNDGDGMSAYDVEYPIQMHGFDPNFHFVGMTFNPEAFADMKDKYWLLNGRSYPDTVSPGPQYTQSSDGRVHYSQPLNAIINIPVGGRALLRISQLSVSEYHTLGSLGIPMHVVGYNAKLLRDQAGNNMDYYTNSITIGGGESLDAILDASNTTLYPAGSKFYLYTPNLDHLSNDAENFGGEMTEVNICNNVDPNTKVCS